MLATQALFSVGSHAAHCMSLVASDTKRTDTQKDTDDSTLCSRLVFDTSGGSSHREWKVHEKEASRRAPCPWASAVCRHPPWHPHALNTQAPAAQHPSPCARSPSSSAPTLPPVPIEAKVPHSSPFGAFRVNCSYEGEEVGQARRDDTLLLSPPRAPLSDWPHGWARVHSFRSVKAWLWECNVLNRRGTPPAALLWHTSGAG